MSTDTFDSHEKDGANLSELNRFILFFFLLFAAGVEANCHILSFPLLLFCSSFELFEGQALKKFPAMMMKS